jgi:hypothetical protein
LRARIERRQSSDYAAARKSLSVTTNVLCPSGPLSWESLAERPLHR